MTDWPRQPLAEVAVVLMGQSPPGSTYNEEGRGLPFLQGSAEFGEHFPKPVKWCSAPAKVAEPGDLMVSVRAPVGDTNLADQRLAIGRGLAVVRGKQGVLTAYLRLVIQAGTPELLELSGGGMFSSITASNLRAVEVPIPSEPEQQRIVDLIEAVDADIAALDAEASRAADLLVALRSDAFDGLERGRELPSVMAVIRSGGTPSRKDPAFYSGDIPWLKSGEVANPWIHDTEEKITPAGLAGSSAWLVPAGSVVVAMYGATAAEVGFLAAPMATNQAVLALVPDPRECDGRFAYHWFCHHSGELKGSASGAAQPNLSKAVILREMSFPNLDSVSQTRIAVDLDAAEHVTECLAREAWALRQCRLPLLSALLAAEVEIPGSYDSFLSDVV